MTRGRGSAHILKAAGTQHRQAVIAAIARRYRESHATRVVNSSPGETLPNEPIAAAIVLRNPTNPYDSNAVQILIDGIHVGFLAKEEAKQWQPVLIECEKRGITLVGAARFIGQDGWGLRIQLRDNLPGFTGPITEKLQSDQAIHSAHEIPHLLDSAKLAEITSALTVNEDHPPTTKRATGALVKRARTAFPAIYGHISALNAQGAAVFAEQLRYQVDELDGALDDLLEAEDAEEREDVTWQLAAEAELLVDALRASVPPSSGGNAR
jgi:hypothetical protein